MVFLLAEIETINRHEQLGYDTDTFQLVDESRFELDL
jgi:hypothetical protein